MDRQIISYFKEDQTANSPGGKGKMTERRKVTKPKKKGDEGERDWIKSACIIAGREKCTKDKRNYQFIAGGGTDNPDVTISWLPLIHFEVKNCATFELPEWKRTLREECPLHKVPSLVLKIPQHVRLCKAVKWWVFFPKECLGLFTSQWKEGLLLPNYGDIDPFPYTTGNRFSLATYIREKHIAGQYLDQEDGWYGLDVDDLPALVTIWAGGTNG